MDDLPSEIQAAIRIIAHQQKTQTIAETMLMFINMTGESDYSMDEIFEAAMIIKQLRVRKPEIYNIALAVLDQKIGK